MRILIACEFSGVVRNAFSLLGHDAWSCDLRPTKNPIQPSPNAKNPNVGIPAQHIRGDVTSVLNDGWDMMIAFPPCTFLCTMGIWWNHKRPTRWQKTFEAMEFVTTLWNAPIPHIAIENPVGYLNSHWQKPNQVTYPWQHGHEANKDICLWLHGLPTLRPTKLVSKGKFYRKKNGSRISAWSHQKSGGPQRAEIAATTFSGVASAMAHQWGNPFFFQPPLFETLTGVHNERTSI